MMIATDRLEIRPFEAADWPHLQRVALDFQKSEYRYYDRPVPTQGDALLAAARYFAGTGLFFAVFVKGAPEMIGYVCFHNDHGSYDMGYCFHSSAHGKGYAFESCGALMEHLARTQPVARFTAGTAQVNAPSMRLLARLGFRQVSAEELCFHEGHPFTGVSLERPVCVE